MRSSIALARLAAANPVPFDAPEPARARRRPARRSVVLALAVAAVAAPTGAFAHSIGDWLGIANEGTPVSTSSVLPGEPRLDEAMQELQLPAQVQQLGTLNGVAFTLSRNAAGHLCLTIDASASPGRWAKGVGCDELDRFPRTSKLLHFPMVDGYDGDLRGVAADGVARVAVLDSSGGVIASTPVVDNLYAGANLPQGDAVAIAALDASGNVVYRQPLHP
jgi:hypothetical protein